MRNLYTDQNENEPTISGASLSSIGLGNLPAGTQVRIERKTNGRIRTTIGGVTSSIWGEGSLLANVFHFEEIVSHAPELIVIISSDIPNRRDAESASPNDRIFIDKIAVKILDRRIEGTVRTRFQALVMDDDLRSRARILQTIAERKNGSK